MLQAYHLIFSKHRDLLHAFSAGPAPKGGWVSDTHTVSVALGSEGETAFEEQA